MDLSSLKNLIPDYAKDLRLNVSSVLSTDGAPGLTDAQIWATALASTIAARNPALLAKLEPLAAEHLEQAQIDAARAAASIMGMNNVYYRFTHLVDGDEYSKLPAKLRMNVIGNPGVERTDFELYSLAVSAVNGCGACVSAHEKVVRKAGLSAEAVQSAVRIAAVMHGVAVAIEARAASEEAGKRAA